MKSIFVCERSGSGKQQLPCVYSEKVIAYLEENAGLDRRIYTKKELLARGKAFDDTEYVFSTWGMPSFTEEEIAFLFPRLRAVFYAAGSVKAFAVPFLSRGIEVISAYAANGESVAEFTLGEILLATKGTFTCIGLCKRNDYQGAHSFKNSCLGNYGTRIGIIGAGMIGRSVIRLLSSFKFEILVYDPFLSNEEAEAMGVKKASLEEVFSSCTVTSNHLPDLETTKGMIKYGHFASMPKYSTFINTGRGAQVVEADMIRALRERTDVSALLDVTLPEPPNADSPLFELPNVILTPHIAGATAVNEKHRMGDLILDEFKAYVHGEGSRYSINAEMLKNMA